MQEQVDDEGFAIPDEDVHHVLTVCGIGNDVVRQVSKDSIH
jgi:hypothetical protein